MSTPNIKVEVISDYLPEQSDPEESVFVFSYHISIINNSDETVQLLDRKWVITDANGIVNEVEGKGVVGEQPVIEANERYEYDSGAILKTPLGCMVGHYGMRTADGDKIKISIPMFTLAVPGLVN